VFVIAMEAVCHTPEGNLVGLDEFGSLAQIVQYFRRAHAALNEV
jgi:hypothetical protein